MFKLLVDTFSKHRQSKTGAPLVLKIIIINGASTAPVVVPRRVLNIYNIITSFTRVKFTQKYRELKK